MFAIGQQVKIKRCSIFCSHNWILANLGKVMVVRCELERVYRLEDPSIKPNLDFHVDDEFEPDHMIVVNAPHLEAIC